MYYCKNCGEPYMTDEAVMCIKCGVAKGQGNNYCHNCGKPLAPDAAVCLNCGVANKQAPAPDAKSKLVAGLLGIFLGTFGVHNFYLGYTGKAITQLVGAAGYTMPLPEKDEMFATKSRMLQDIMVSLGGRIAEEIIFGDITTGASSDIKKATKTARRMVTRYGMSDNIGVICYDDDDDEVFIGKDLAHAKAHSEEISGEIDKEVKRIIDDCYTKAKDIIMQHENVLHSCAKLLLEKEKINREEFEALFV